MVVKVVELFAGVGGFRLGLQNASPLFHTVWWNQWEPSSVRKQHAWECYKRKLCDPIGEVPRADTNADINEVEPADVPAHNLLVGGFPCQDYSVATSLDKAGGIKGKKGVLWWAIRDILREQEPEYVLLENVDRLLKSPADQRGRDFAVLLACMRELGYYVEWRVLNAAECGAAQRRRRVFIFAAKSNTAIARHMKAACRNSDYLYTKGFFACRFPTNPRDIPVGVEEPELVLWKDARRISAKHDTPFQKAGIMVDGEVWMHPVETRPSPLVFLQTCLDPEKVDSKYLLDMSRIEEWNTAKGPKKIPREAENGFQYTFAEGGMTFPDRVDYPGRTVLTSEANRTPNRTTHVIKDKNHEDAYRFLTPTEVERLMGFPEKWTEGMPDRWRYFTMGNALVVPLVTEMGHQLLKWIEDLEPPSRKEALLEPKKAEALERAVRVAESTRTAKPRHK